MSTVESTMTEKDLIRQVASNLTKEQLIIKDKINE